jgi:hypothetical protein
MELPSDVGHLESRFGLFEDSVSGDSLCRTHDRCTFCTERTIGSEIILDAPNRTPR